MSIKKGFTLIEITAVMMIIGVLAALAIPSYVTSLSQGSAKAAQNNLINIFSGEKNYYLNNNSFYISPYGPPNDLTNIDTKLSLNIKDTSYNYVCNNTGGFQCKATSISNNNIVLKINNSVTGVVLLHGTNCATPNAVGCNPTCTSNYSNAFCPTS